MSDGSRASGAPPEAGTGGTNGDRGHSGARSGLLTRIVLGVGGLGAGLVIVFALLLIAVVGLRHRSLEARRSQEVIATANGLQTLVIDFETGLRGFVIWKQQRYLRPWQDARKRYPTEMTKLIRLTAHDRHQRAAAYEIKTAIDAYLNSYSLPLVRFLQRNPDLARPVAASETGSRQGSRDDLEERNRRLVESERLKTELVSNVSHELRTPLASVLGFSDLMLKRDIGSDERRRYLEVIRSESGRLATLLNDLLDLQRQELGVLELRAEEFDLNELLRVQTTLYSAQSEVHELSFEPAPEPLLVYGDPDRLAQVIGN